ncbi:MAG: hypothetical protein OXC68_10825 [Aestuariivita sp.]|nr:hypothetical protein [Aestuariivita sp.]
MARIHYSQEKRAELRKRAIELIGRPVNMTCPRTVLALTCSTVNTCWRKRITNAELAEALWTENFDVPQVFSFFTEIRANAQRIFAAEFGMDETHLVATARAFKEWSNWPHISLLDE